MNTDKHLYEIFEAYPQWVFELTGRPWTGPCRFQSVTIKAIQRSADGVLIPEVTGEAILVVEFQMYRDPQIYGRVVVEMAVIQEEHAGRDVQGILIFGSKELDPQTAPWSRVVSAYYLDEMLTELEQSCPDHPLIALFQPLIEKDNKRLQENANEVLKELLKDSTAGDLMGGLHWTHKSMRKLAVAIKRRGIEVSHVTIGRLMSELKFSLRTNRKRLAKTHDPNRDQQFRLLTRRRNNSQRQNWPIISIDCKKKELIGNLKNPGKTWRTEALDVYDHDFPSWTDGRVVPFGIYDIAKNRGFMVVELKKNGDISPADAAKLGEKYTSLVAGVAKALNIFGCFDGDTKI